MNPLDPQSKRLSTPDSPFHSLDAMNGGGGRLDGVCIDAIALDGDKLKPRVDQRKGGNGFGVKAKRTWWNGADVATTTTTTGYNQLMPDKDRFDAVVECYENNSLKHSEVCRTLTGNHDDRVTDTGTSVVHVGMAQNTRDEVRIVGDGEIVGALLAEPGMKQQTYVVSTNSNGEDVAPTLTLELARQTGAQQANGGGIRHHPPRGRSAR